MPLFQPDPLNPLRFVIPAETPADREQIRSIVQLPDAPPQPLMEFQLNIKQGQLEPKEFTNQFLGNSRPIWIYIPPNYNPNEAFYPLLILFDGWASINLMAVPAILDNLIEAGKLPPMLAVFVDAPNAETRNRELPCYPPFANFMAQEFLPWLRENYAITCEASQICVGGASYGALAAAYLGFMHPELFGLVFSQSGSFWWKPEDDKEHEWLVRQFEASPKLPLKIHQEVGTYETTDTPNNGPTQLEANRHLHQVLQSKGYAIVYHEFMGGHEYLNWRGTIADALVALYR